MSSLGLYFVCNKNYTFQSSRFIHKPNKYGSSVVHPNIHCKANNGNHT